MTDHGAVARQRRVMAPAPGCLIAILAPIVAVLVAALVLMVTLYRQERANDRNEAEALTRTATLARIYARDVLTVPTFPPGRETVHGIAERHDGKLISYSRSGNSLATTVRFFGEFKDTSMFGTDYSRTYRCYSIVFREDASGEPREKTTQLEKCDLKQSSGTSGPV
ncbi:hypothetical protein [Streptomyces sp. NPDC058739]|uniref:hypothetical protein n=1 Tax=Streptomyces sp. NPDC058739 TaxID=3346618 RepID=UPI0036ACF003